MGRIGDVVAAGRSLATGAVIARGAGVARLRPLAVPAELAEALDSGRQPAAGADLPASVAGLQAAMGDGQLSSVALTAALVARIVAHDAGCTAMIELNPEALAEARAADERRARGETGPLLGVPVTVKDNIETAGPMRTTAGAALLLDHVAPGDAPVVTALRAAGAVVLGTANLSELAGAVCRTPGFSAVGGQTVHPRGAAFSPGGSSSGSAVSVAAGLAPLSVGTETSGSLLAPASFTGVVGMKPSAGLVPTDGIVPLVRGQDSAGPLGRSVADVAVLLHVLSAGAVPAEPGPAGLDGVRVGVLRGAILAQRSPYEATDSNPAVLERIDAALRAAGAVPADVVLAEAVEGVEGAVLTVVLGGVTHDTMGYLAGTRGPVSTLAELHAYNLREPRRRMPKGQAFLSLALARDISRDHYEQAAEQLRTDARRIVAATFEAARAEVLVSLSNLHSPYYAAAGFPAITVPMGLRPDGMPVGVTLIGRAGADAGLLAAAAALEAARATADESG
ncbi:MAG TPA: amidase family protein [Candidatus Nanopelagicales bacterium]